MCGPPDWRQFYPPDQPELLTRFVLDALKVWGRVEDGHRAVNTYKMEDKAHLVEAETLVVAGDEDPFSFPRMGPLSENIKNSRTMAIEGGMVPMVDQLPEEFARVVLDFLDADE